MAHSHLLMQLVVILVCARVVGLVLRYFGQPLVIGEMIAGLLLGPAVFGLLAPELFSYVFEPSTLPQLDAIAQLGLALYMFIVGAELRFPTDARAQLNVAGWIASCSIIVPAALGLAVAGPLHRTLAPPGVQFWPFALFMMVAVSITALPVLARILKDRGETQTAIGRLALSSSAMADVFMWLMLGLVLVLAGTGSNWSRFFSSLAGAALLGAVLFTVVRGTIARLLLKHVTEGNPTPPLLAVLVIGALATASITAALDLHPVIGAFLFGACLPRDDRLLHSLVERIEHVAVLVLMPVFFAFAGLNTAAAAFEGTRPTALILLLGAAIVGKIIGATIGARIGGQGWHDSLALGSLMNTRGMMELIVIKVGLDAGIIGKELFTMLLVMAIVTTMMTSPLLNLLASRKNRALQDGCADMQPPQRD